MSKRGKKGLQVARGERYALLPEEVLESDAYHAQPDWARSVLVALAACCNGHNNGNLSLVMKEARRLGIAAPWKLYAGLQLNEKASLIVCTRRGHLANGTKLCSLFALTWRGINPTDDVQFDAGITACPLPSNAWAKWKKPADWKQQVKAVSHANHGKSKTPKDDFRAIGAKIPVSTMLGNGRSTMLGTESAKIAQQCWVEEAPFPVPSIVDTSKTLGAGSGNSHSADSATHPKEPLKRGRSNSKKNGASQKNAVHRLMKMHDHLPDADIAKLCNAPIELVAEVRRSLP